MSQHLARRTGTVGALVAAASVTMVAGMWPALGATAATAAPPSDTTVTAEPVAGDATAGTSEQDAKQAEQDAKQAEQDAKQAEQAAAVQARQDAAPAAAAPGQQSDPGTTSAAPKAAQPAPTQAGAQVQQDATPTQAPSQAQQATTPKQTAAKAAEPAAGPQATTATTTTGQAPATPKQTSTTTADQAPATAKQTPALPDQAAVTRVAEQAAAAQAQKDAARAAEEARREQEQAVRAAERSAAEEDRGRAAAAPAVGPPTGVEAVGRDRAQQPPAVAVRAVRVGPVVPVVPVAAPAVRTGPVAAPAAPMGPQVPVRVARRGEGEASVAHGAGASPLGLPLRPRGAAGTDAGGSAGVRRDIPVDLAALPTVVTGAAETVASRPALPLGIAGVVILFLLIQGRIDRRDPKLALARLEDDEPLEFAPGGGVLHLRLVTAA